MAKSKSRSTSTKTDDAAPKVKSPAPSRQRGNGRSQIAPPEVVTTVTHDQIARKAYEIWVAKGRPVGQEEQNWREAEAAMTGQAT